MPFRPLGKGFLTGAVDPSTSFAAGDVRRIARVEANTAATRLPLSAGELADLNKLAGRVGVRGNRYDEHHMSPVGK
ncbi:hypothetical protein ACWCRD_16165 [Streptomyces sp. NPDC002092]